MLPPDAQTHQPIGAEILPVGEPFQIGAGLAEEFALHLLEFPGAEGKIARRNLVAESLAHLAHAEGQLAPGGALDVGKVDENPLGGFRPEITGAGGILRHADGGLKHQVELADGGEVVLAAHRAHHILMLRNESIHLIEIHGVGVDLRMSVADELIGAVPGLAALAIQQRIGKTRHMAGGHPGLRVHKDGRVQPNVGGALLDEFFPPGALNVVFQLHTQGAVVPGVGQSPVNVGAGIYKAPVFAQGHNFFHGFVFLPHVLSRLSVPRWLPRERLLLFRDNP